MENQAQTLSTYIVECMKYASETNVNHETKTVDNGYDYVETITYTFFFNVCTEDHTYITKLRNSERTLRRYVKYLSNAFEVSIGVDIDNYERQSRFGHFRDEIMDNKTGFARGSIIMTFELSEILKNDLHENLYSMLINLKNNQKN